MLNFDCSGCPKILWAFLIRVEPLKWMYKSRYRIDGFPFNDFYGEKIGKISNQYLSVEYLQEGGPHIPRLYLADNEENLFAEAPGFDLPTEYGIYHFRGGHRFCHAPEYVPRSYIPDQEGLSYEMLPD